MSNAAASLYKATPRQTYKFVVNCIQAQLVAFIQSSPGLGKSSIVSKIAKDHRLKLIDHRLSTSDPTDLTGLPWFDDRGFARFAPFADLFPMEDTPLPLDENGEELDGWLLFLDEFNSAPKAVQAAAYKLILDRMIGQHRLHPNVAIVAAGNLSTDRAIVNSLSTAMQSRLIHIEMVENFQEWLEDVAIPEGYDSRIIAFLSQYPSKLMDFRPDHQDRTFCCPRTWEFANRLITHYDSEGNPIPKEVTDDTTILLTGAITSGVATEFVKFTQVYDRLITVDQIVRDPEGCALPGDMNLKWATVTHMAEKTNNSNFGALSTYANRFDLSFRILFYRIIMIRHPHLRTHPEFAKRAAQITQDLSS